MNQSGVVQQLLSAILGMVPGGNLLNMFTPMLSQWMSPSGSLANRFVWPEAGETTSMAAIKNLNDVISGSYGYGASNASNELHLRALDRYNKMLNPGLSDKEIRVKSEAMANNPLNIESMVLSHLDPYGANAGIHEASNLAATLQKRSAGPVSLAGARYAADISRTIFGEDGKSGIVKDIIDRPGAYGNMKLADVMHIGKELAYTDSTGFNDGGKFNSDRFKKSIKEMSQALEPWKDVFGTDIPELMKQLEALTGQGLSVQRATMRASGSRMAAVMQATGANIQNITSYRDALSEGMRDPTMRNRAILGAHSVAADMVLGTANSGRSSMTTEEFQSSAGRYYANTATAGFTDKYALAYSKWANETNELGFRATASNYKELYDKAIKAGFSQENAASFASKHIDISHREFRAAYDKASSRGLTHEEAVESATNDIKASTFARKYREARDSGLDHDAALMQISKAKSNADLEVYRNTEFHLSSIKNGDAARMNREDIIRDVNKYFMSDYADNKGRYTAGGDGTSGTGKLVRDHLRKLSTNELAEFMAMDKDKKVKYLMDKQILHEGNVQSGEAMSIVNDIHASYAKSFRVATGQSIDSEQASQMAQLYITESKNEAKAKEYEKFSEAVRRMSDPGGLQSVLEKVEASGGKLSPIEAIKSFTGGVDILDSIIEAGMFKGKDGKFMDAKAIRNAANFALNNYTSLATDYKDIYADVMGERGQYNKEKGMKVMAALGALGQQQLSSMSTEKRTEYINTVRDRIDKAGDKADITKIAKDTYIDQKMGSLLTEYEKSGKLDDNAAKEIKTMRKLLDDSTVSSMEELRNLAIKSNISEDTFNRLSAESGASDVDGVDPIARLCRTLDSLVKGMQDLIKNMPKKGD